MTKWTAAWLAAVMLATAASARAADVSLADDSPEWIDARGSLRLRIDPNPGLDRLRIVIGQTDYSGQVRADFAAGVELLGTPVRLPAGENSLSVYAVEDDGSWTELAALPIRVLTRAGLEVSEVDPRLDLNNESQHRQKASGDAFAASPSEYYRLAGNGGLSTRHARGGWSLSSDWNLTGNSQREAALQFGTKGSDASKIDLAGYRVDLVGPRLQIGVGHVPLGRNALLLDNVTTRGVVASVQVLPWMDVQAGAVNGTSIVGFDRILGVQTRTNLMTGASLGLDVPTGGYGTLRVEASMTDSELEAQTGFDIGEVADTERSRGQGARLAYATPGGSFSLEALYARSRYVNPFDPALAFGGELVEVREETRSARRGQFNWSPLSGVMVGELNLGLNLSGSHAQADPLYKTIGAFVAADQRQDNLSASAFLGIASVSLSLAEARDNLDDVPTLLTTKTRQHGATLNIGLDQLEFARGASGSWLPALDLSLNRTRQFAANSPPTEDSGFNTTNHLPDQVTETAGFGLSWAHARGSFGYRLDLSDQDNRQEGRERADFFNRVHNFSLQLSPFDALSLDLGYSASDNEDIEQTLTQNNRSYNVAFNWRFIETASLSARWFDSADDDSLGNASANTKSAEAALNWNFELPVTADRRVPVAFFIRYARQESESRDNVFDFSSAGRSWTINSGVSATLF